MLNCTIKHIITLGCTLGMKLCYKALDKALAGK